MALPAAGAVWPAVGHTQRPGAPLIGYLCPESSGPFASRILAFRAGLAEVGYAEGNNVGIEFRWAEGQYERLPALAADLATRPVAVIVAPGGAPVAFAAKSASSTIPIVFEMGGDPIALGVVHSLNRPEGNVTGISSLSVEASLKRLELLREAIPSAKLIGAVINPTSPTAAPQVRNLQSAADALRLRFQVLEASDERQIELVFEAASRLQAGGLVFTSDPFFAFRSQPLAALALRHTMPTITQSRDFTEVGGFMSYGGDFVQSHRQTGVYAGRIVRGERPSDLPVQRITRLELLINLTTAKRFGISVPLALLARADAVIE